MRESVIETYLREQVAKHGGAAYKFVSPGHKDVPDRIVLLPFGEIIFVELKATGKSATPAQAREHERLRALGFRVEVINGKFGVDLMLGGK